MSGRARPTWKRRADLSQHFLRDGSARRLVRATSIAASSFVIEIGAGRGALTKVLLERVGRLTAVEIDPYLAARLRREMGGRAEIVEGDFLDLELPQGEYTLIGNLPFAGSTDIVRKITAAANPPTDAWLVVQREFAARLCGHPYGGESLWSLRLKPFWHLEIIDTLTRAEFTPPPSVDAALLKLQPRGRPILCADEVAQLDRLLGTGFARPALRQSLKPLLSRIQLRRLAAEYCFRIDDPPGALTFGQWLGILRFLQRDGFHA